VPNLVVNVDIHGASCLILLLSAYLATTAADAKPITASSVPHTPYSSGRAAAPGASASASHAGGSTGSMGVNSKSVMQRVLMADPTLRTLFWLEEQENKKKKAGTCFNC